jgi:hypothetical protein
MFKVCALAVCAWLAVVPAARAQVQLSIRNGRVTIVAKDATVRQILAEWARVGKTRIINGERIPGGPITLELKDVSETEALDVLLRSLSGYMAAPRTSLTSGDASVFDSIVVVPTIAAAAPRTSAPAGSPAPFAPSPTFTQQEDDQDPNAPGRPGGAPQQPGARPPIFTTFPAPQNGNPNTGARPTLPTVRPGQVSQPPPTGEQPLSQPFVPPVPQQAPPSAPPTSPGVIPNPQGGVSAPGMIATPPSQPGQPQRPPN